MRHAGLYAAVRRELGRLLNGYVEAPAIREMDSYVVAPELGERAGVLGALVLAEEG